MVASHQSGFTRGSSPGTGVAESLLEALWFGEDDEARPRDQAARGLALEIARIQALRPFPAAAQKLLRLLSDESFDRKEVNAVIEHDPSLAARTLAVANSPLFRSRLACRTIDDATRRLGSRSLRDVAVGVAAMSMFREAPGAGTRIRDHSVGVAAVVRMLAELVIPAEASALFLTGLLHDVGQLLLLQTEELTYAHDEPFDDTTVLKEREALGYDHAVLGGLVMNLWRIPEPAAQIVGWHHQHARALEGGGQVALMVALLRAADRIEPVLASRRELDEELVRYLGEDAAWSYAELSLGDLRQLWPAMVEARAEMLSALT